jgi:microcystin-dependent protein
MRVFKSRGSRKEISEYVYKAGAAERNGLKLCNGQALSRSVYAALFAEIGTTFGAGDGSTTFNLPDFRGRVPGSAGQGTYASSFDNTAVNVTTNVITVIANDSLFTGTTAVLSTTGGAPAGLTAGNTYYVIRVSSTEIKLATTLANAIAGTAIDITSQGTGIHTLTVTYTNRAIGSIAGEESHSLTVAEIPAHNHVVETVQTASQNSLGGGDTRANSTNKNTQNTGGSGSHNIMQPTIFAGHWFIYTGVGG